jgi:hypothetical protein
MNTGSPWPRQSARHPALRDALARALTVREAEGVASGPILRELKQEPNPGLGDPLGDGECAHDRTQALKNLRPARRRSRAAKPDALRR